MASLLSVVDLARLLPIFSLAQGSEIELAMYLEDGFFPAVCSKCGQRFRIELMYDGFDVLFNYEDLRCPSGCNKNSVALADLNEQLRYDELERFFEAQPDPSLLPPGALFLRLLVSRHDH